MLRWRDIPLGGRLLLVSFVAVIPLIMFVFIGLLQGSRNEELHRWVNHTYAVKASAADMLRLSVDRETGLRGYLLTGQVSFLEPLYAARSVFDRRLEELEKLVEDNPAQKTRVERIRQLSNKLKESRDQTIAQIEQGRAAEALRWMKSGDGKRLMDEIRQLSNAIQDEEDRLLALRLDTAERWNTKVYWTRIVGGSGVVLFSIFVAFIFAASLRRHLSQLEQGTTAIAAGQYGHRVSVTTGAELGSLASAMNTMAETIMGRDEELQAQNEELQAQQTELEAANVELEAAQTELEDANERLSCSQAELNQFFTLSLDLFCLAGFDGYFKRLNPAWETVLGFTLQELQSRPYLEFIHPDDRQLTTATAQHLTREGSIINFENRYLCKDGSYKWFLWSATSSSEAQLHYAVARDITEHKHLEDALQQKTEMVERERNQYHHLMDSSTDGLAMADLQGNITFMNATFAKTLGIEHRHEYFGKPVVEARAIALARVKDPEPYQRFLEKIWRDPEASEEVFVEFLDGTALRLRSGPVRDSERRIVGRNLTFADQTRERAVDRMKSEFVATVSHEIRTPLASLLGFSELLLNRNVPAEKRQLFLETIHRETTRLTNLINDFLDLQRIESGNTTYDLRPTDLRSVLRAVEQVFSAQMAGHRLIINVPQELPPVRADRDRLQQVFANLLSNAIKYSPNGGDIIVSAILSFHADVVEISVQDHGLGIPADAMPKIFEKFFRVDSTDRRKIGGTGLGLALCKEIINAHGGNIIVTSTVGQGTTFTLTIPTGRIRTASTAVPQGAEPDSRDAYVLVVEDDVSFAKLVGEHLINAGFRMNVTSTAEEAFSVLKHHPPMLVLLDIHLAGKMDGWDLLMKMKQEPGTWNLPIIIISITEKKTKGLALGIRDYLIKPFEMDHFVDSVQRIVGVGKGQRILIADDDQALRGSLGEALRGTGYEVVEAGDGLEALMHVEASLPELLVLDLLMPKIDGFDVLSRLRKDKETLKLPVLVITGASLSKSERDFVLKRLASLLPKSEYSANRLFSMMKILLQEKSPQLQVDQV